MFNQHRPAPAAHVPPPHRPPQQQLHQQMIQLQQLLQQQQHRPHPRVLPSGARPVAPSPQPQQPTPPTPQPHPQSQMMTMRATSHATILGPNPMLQQALFMQRVQGSMRGFTMGPAPALQQFFAHTRHSILGTPPPISISMKPPQMGFPGISFQQQNRMFYKDYLKGFERKRELEPESTSQARGNVVQPTEKAELDVPKAASEAEHNIISPAEPEGREEPASEDGPEPSAKRLKSLEEGGCDSETIVGVSQEEEPDSPTGPDNHQECEADCVPNEQNFSLDSKTIETPSAGSSLKVTIQQRSESRAISTTAQKPGPRSSDGTSITQLAEDMGPRFFCYICKANYHSQEQFQSHMATAEHQQRLQEIQHITNSCLVTFMPVAKDNQQPVAGKDGKKKPPRQRWCNVCQSHFSGDLIPHRRTTQHKHAKYLLRPFCTVCSRHFKTPRKFVEHMKSPEHKKKAKEERLADKEPAGPEDAEELITVDAVGCFEDEEEETGEEENADAVFENEECITRPSGVQEEFAQECEEDGEYCADTVYGLDFVVPVAGYLCRLCHKFYPSDSAARLAHCKSLMHFQNVQKQRAAKIRVPSESGTCPQKSGTSLEDDLKPSSTSDRNVSQDPAVEGSILHVSSRDDGEDKDCVPLTAEDSENEIPKSKEQHGGEAAEEGAESLLMGDQPLEVEDSTKGDASPSLCRRSSRRRIR